MKRKKKPKSTNQKAPYCKNCLLYNFQKQHCNVVILYEGKKINPPTSPEDYCLFETQYVSIDETGKQETWKPEIKEIKMWVENPNTGEKGQNGIVKIEYPDELEMNQD